MLKTPPSPPKPRKPVAVAIMAANWPAWTPRQANPQPISESVQPALEDAATTQHERVAMLRTIGQRLRDARELSGLSQQEAAKELGYANSSKLAKVENASDTFSVPIALVIKAASLYEVSSDYLLGISEDWDVSLNERWQRQIGRWLFEQWQTARERDLAALSDVSKKMSFVAGAVAALADGADSTLRAFDKLRSLNPSYEDLIGGARLQAAIEALADAGRQARLQLRRLHLDLAGEHAGADVAGV